MIRRPLRPTRPARAPSALTMCPRPCTRRECARRFRRGLITKRNEGPSTSDERPITGRGLLCRPRGWVHADHPILQVQPGSGVTIMKASPGTRVQRPGDDDGVTPPSAPRHEGPSENPAPLTAHITRSPDGCSEGAGFTRNPWSLRENRQRNASKRTPATPAELAVQRAAANRRDDLWSQIPCR